MLLKGYRVILYYIIKLFYILYYNRWSEIWWNGCRLPGSLSNKYTRVFRQVRLRTLHFISFWISCFSSLFVFFLCVRFFVWWLRESMKDWNISLFFLIKSRREFLPLCCSQTFSFLFDWYRWGPILFFLCFFYYLRVRKLIANFGQRRVFRQVRTHPKRHF